MHTLCATHRLFHLLTPLHRIYSVAYQPRGGLLTGTDPLTNEASCQKDAQLMKDLGLNVIRVYEVG